MKKIILVLSLLILQLSIISAYTSGKDGIDILIKNDTIDAKSYIFYGGATPYVKNLVTTGLVSSLNCVPFNLVSGNLVSSNETILTNCTYTFVDKSITINLTDVCLTNETISRRVDVDEGTIINYTQCLDTKSQIETNLRNCASDYYKCNITSSEYVKCNADLAVCNIKQTTIDDLNKQIEDMKNQRYIFGVVGLVAGIVGYMFYTGKIGGQKAKQAGENYQRGQSA